MLVFITAGVAALTYRIPVAFAIVALLAIVVTSYRQTVRAYPRGGGSYIVARENLGTIPGLIAAAAILTDYVLTVAVSITAGTIAITSAAPSLAEHKVLIASGLVALVTAANLRGVKEAGALLRAPDVRLRRHRWHHDRHGPVAVPLGVPHGGHRRSSRGARGRRDALPRAPRVLLRRVRAHRRRGGRRRRAGVPPTPGQERRRDARDHGLPRQCLVPRDHRAVGAPRRPDHGGGRALAVRAVADRRRGLRRRPGVHPAADLHGGDPHPRGEHRVPGLPSPVLDPGPRSVHAEPVPQPRRPARVLERRARPRRARALPRLALRRLAHPA